MRSTFHAAACLEFAVLCVCCSRPAEAAAPKPALELPRLAVLTDIGGDPDDQQSLIRLLTYANEFEIEALVATASGTRGELKQAVVRPDLIRETVRAYGKALPNLRRHAVGWPAEQRLLACVKSGNPQRERAHIGAGHDTEGSRFLVERIDAGAPSRPLNVTIWGGQTDLAQALWRVKQDRGAAGFEEFVKKVRVYDIADQDGIAEWMRGEFPGMNYILANAFPGHDKREGVFRGMYLTGDESLTSRQWVEANVLGCGPLGALYPFRTSTAPNPHGCLKEGDTPSWFFFLPRGGNDPGDPSKPGWGGQFERQADGWHRDIPAKEGFDPRSTVSKWRGDFQRDFALRMSWCRPETEAGGTATATTKVSIVDGKWRLNGETTYRGAKAEGLLMNVRMVNATFEDANEKTCPKGFDPDANAERFIAQIPIYVAHGVRAFTLCLQGGHCGYEGAVNSAFEPDGSLRETYMKRVKRVIEACDRHGAVVILGCYYQRQDQILKDDDAVRSGLVHAVKWIKSNRFTNVVLEVANEFAHGGYNRKILKSVQGEAELIALAKKTSPELLVATSGMGGGELPDELAKAGDFVLIHFNTTKLEDVPARIAALKKHGKPIVCNEDDKVGEAGAKSAELCVAGGASWGFMHSDVNQYFPKLSFNGAADDPLVYATIKRLTTAAAAAYFPPPDAQGGWRKAAGVGEIRRVAGLDKQRLDEAFQFIQGSTKNGGLLVVRHGWLVYEDYFGLGRREATPNLASCGKSFTSIAVGMLMADRPDLFPLGLDQKVFTPTYFPPQAFPLSDARKRDVKLGQLLAFTAGIRGNNPCFVHGKATNIDPAGPDGWQALVDESALGQRNADAAEKSAPSAATLWCNPGEGYSYATASIHLASIMLRHVAGLEMQEYLEHRVAKPLGWGRWGFAYKNQPQVTHTPGGGGIALRATDMLRFGYLLLQEGHWQDKQIVPAEYVRLCARKSPYNPHYPYSLQFNVNTDGEIPELPRDAFWKSGSGGHALYVVPSLDLVVWKLGGRDDQYSPANTGLSIDPEVAGRIQPRAGWKTTTNDAAAISKTLELVVASIEGGPRPAGSSERPAAANRSARAID